MAAAVARRATRKAGLRAERKAGERAVQGSGSKTALGRSPEKEAEKPFRPWPELSGDLDGSWPR
jgi:hypothetical protein